jgi:hypothetical protein
MIGATALGLLGIVRVSISPESSRLSFICARSLLWTSL